MATVVTIERTDLIRVEKGDYNRILKFIHEKQIKEIVFFLSKLDLFNGWTSAALKSLADVIDWETVNKGSIICQEGSNIDHVYIIRKGTCKVFKELKRIGKMIEIGEINSGEYFGELCALITDPNMNPPKSPFTVIAYSDTVDLASLSAFDAKSKIGNGLNQSNFYSFNQETMEKVFNQLKLNKRWNQFKKDTILKFWKEKYNNPNLKS
jgi:signal-transduction protein with cAMP-binding, CBS, and nucleotidyltransferase domain